VVAENSAVEPAPRNAPAVGRDVGADPDRPVRLGLVGQTTCRVVGVGPDEPVLVGDLDGATLGVAGDQEAGAQHRLVRRTGVVRRGLEGDARRAIDERADGAVCVAVAEDVALRGVLEGRGEAVADVDADRISLVVPFVDACGPIARVVAQEVAERVILVGETTRTLGRVLGVSERIIFDGDAASVDARLFHDATAGVMGPSRRRSSGQRLRDHVPANVVLAGRHLAEAVRDRCRLPGIVVRERPLVAFGVSGREELAGLPVRHPSDHAGPAGALDHPAQLVELRLGEERPALLDAMHDAGDRVGMDGVLSLAVDDVCPSPCGVVAEVPGQVPVLAPGPNAAALGVVREVERIAVAVVVNVLVRGARVIGGGAEADAAPRAGRDARADRLGLGVLDADGPGLLGVEEDLLGAPLVLEAELVEVGRRPSHGRAALDAGLGAVRRQVVRRHLLGVVDAPGDQRLVRIALEEGDDHLLADAGNRDDAPVLAGPVLRDANPAGAVLVRPRGRRSRVKRELAMHRVHVDGAHLLVATEIAVDSRTPRCGR
jgi:hypothetical protein